jgi:hypothetical protein
VVPSTLFQGPGRHVSEESGMKIELGNLELDDYSELRKAMEEAYAELGGDYWPHDRYPGCWNCSPRASCA